MSESKATIEKNLEKSRILQQAICEAAPIETIRNIIKDGADVNYREMSFDLIFKTMYKELHHQLPPGMTSLMLAAKYGRTDVIECLLQHKADVNAKNDLGMTALMFACKWKKVESAELLIKAGADVKVGSNTPPRTPGSSRFYPEDSLYNSMDYNNTALHFALQFIHGGRAGEGIPTSLYPSLPLVKMLLAEGADIDVPGFNGITPLGFALSSLRSFDQMKEVRPLFVGYVESELHNGIKELHAIIPLIWQKGPKIGNTVFSTQWEDGNSQAISDCNLSPEVSMAAEASIVVQAEYCLTTNDLDLSDLTTYAKFIKENMGAFAKPIFQHVTDKDRKIRKDVKPVEVLSSQAEASSSHAEVLSSQTEAPKARPSLLHSAYKMTSDAFSSLYHTIAGTAGDSKTLDEQMRAEGSLENIEKRNRANFIEAMTNLAPPHSFEIYSLVYQCLPCNFNVTKIVIDYHDDYYFNYFPKGFHPMIKQLRDKRMDVLFPGWRKEETKATKDVPSSSAAASAP